MKIKRNVTAVMMITVLVFSVGLTAIAYRPN